MAEDVDLRIVLSDELNKQLQKLVGHDLASYVGGFRKLSRGFHTQLSDNVDSLHTEKFVTFLNNWELFAKLFKERLEDMPGQENLAPVLIKARLIMAKHAAIDGKKDKTVQEFAASVQ